MTNITVSNVSALNSALSSAHAGDTILLQAGVYSGVNLQNKDFGAGIKIVSADQSNPAVLTNFNMQNVEGVTFQHLDFKAVMPANVGFNVYSSQNITFDQVSVHGSLDGNPTNDAGGFSVFDSQGITVTGSEFQQLIHGMAFARSSDIVVAGNHIHDMESDGLDFAQVANVKITGNVLHDFHPAPGDHPDGIQFMTYGTTTPSHDIEISGNLIYRGTGAYTQGIFMGDELTTMPFTRVVITDNTIIGTGWNGILTTHSVDLTVSGNNLITLAGQNQTYLLVDNANGVVANNNHASSIGFTATTNLTQSGNVGNAPTVADGGAAAIRDWLATHVTPPVGTPTPTPPPVGTPTPGGPLLDAPQTIIGTGADGNLLGGLAGDTITGSAGNEYIRGNGGNDLVAGGAGHDDINGNTGDDNLRGGSDNDWVVGGQGNDIAAGDLGSDIVWGNLGSDTLSGGDGADQVRGGRDNDSVAGGAGDDFVSGDRGDDTVAGGAGADLFHGSQDAGLDVISDFNVAEGDRVMLDPGTTYTIAQVNRDTVIDMGGGNKMILLGVDLHSLPPGSIIGV